MFEEFGNVSEKIIFSLFSLSELIIQDPVKNLSSFVLVVLRVHSVLLRLPLKVLAMI